MIDSFLYRRFFVVATAIAAMAAGTANLILETRPADYTATIAPVSGCGVAGICPSSGQAMPRP